MTLHQQGDSARAEGMYRQVLAIMPEEPNSWHLLGAAAWQRGDLPSAEEFIRKAIQYNDKASAYYANLGGVLKQKGDLPDAITQFEKAVSIDPMNEGARKSLSESLHAYGMEMMHAKKLDEAKSAYRRVLQLEPNNVPTLNNLAMLLQHEGERAIARGVYDRALKVEPDNMVVRYNRSISVLTEGRLEEGWKDFAFSEPYWRQLQDPRKHLPWLQKCALWDGSNLRGKKILVWGDQGIGDEIVYASMVPDLMEQGAEVTIECMDRLIPIFTRSSPTARILARQDPPLPDAAFDFHAPGMWLPRWLRPTMESFPPRRSFISADTDVTKRLRERYAAFGKKRIIGLSWFTISPDWGLRRSIPLPDILAELPLDDVLIVDLQYADTAGAWQEAREKFPNLCMIHDDEVDQFKDMDMYTAQVAACDYVITISNTTSHVAGALGIPASILMPQEGLTWYWFEAGENCPWYPSIRLLRPTHKNRIRDAVAAAMGDTGYQ